MSNFKKQSLAFVLLLSLLQPTPVFAATKSPAGQVCKKKSATTTFAKETYICKLVGKKLLWTLQVKKVVQPVQPVQPVLSWAEIEAKAAAEKAMRGDSTELAALMAFGGKVNPMEENVSPEALKGAENEITKNDASIQTMADKLGISQEELFKMLLKRLGGLKEYIEFCII